MDTGDRKKLESWPEFKDFSEEYRVRKAKQDAQAALARAERVEKHGTAAKFLIVALVLAVIGAAVGLFFVTRQTVSETSQTPDELADLFAAGKIPVSGSAGILPLARGGAHRTGRRPDRPRSAGGALSYEDAMNQAVDLGNVESGGGEQQLTAQKVAAAMNANIRRFGACVGIDPSVRSVSMNLAITGNGSIVGVSVSQGSPAFRQCIGSRARSIRLPPFSAPRMGASFHFSW